MDSNPIILLHRKCDIIETMTEAFTEDDIRKRRLVISPKEEFR
jgi:hypothetical protein